VPLENANPDGRILTYADADIYWPHFNRNYIALYRPEQAQLVADIIGEDMDDERMWQQSLSRAQAEAAADPENAFFWFNLGTSYNAVGDYEKAASASSGHERGNGMPRHRRGNGVGSRSGSGWRSYLIVACRRPSV
jgi:hypothetical protein